MPDPTSAQPRTFQEAFPEAQGLTRPDPTSADPNAIQGVRVTYTTTSAGPGADVHVQCRAELDALRAELADYKAGAAEEARAGDEARAQVASLRARLEQTEAVVSAAQKYRYHVGQPAALALIEMVEALRALPEAPPVAAGTEK